MPKITDYSFLFQSMFGRKSTNLVNTIQLSQLNSGSVKSQLKAAGIDTNSKQYNSSGDWIDSNTGLTGLNVTDENRNSYKHTISIPESSRDEMFELAKKEFLKENGTLNGDTTKRESVYTNLYKKMKKDDRLSAGWTLEQYEHQY